MPAVLENGQRIFQRDCAHCHGPHGDGISPNRQTLHPAPFDLTSFELTDSFILRVVREGVEGADMPGWRLGTDEEVRAVSAYTVTLGRPDELPAEDRYAPPEALHEAGRRIYTMHCISCHGEQGRGDGPDAVKHLPRPASFADMRPSYAAARRVIENGVHGTAMPSWPLLTSPEIQAVTFYIRTLYTNSRAVGARP
jgi:mono/diheme cytochrome c family protein